LHQCVAWPVSDIMRILLTRTKKNRLAINVRGHTLGPYTVADKRSLSATMHAFHQLRRSCVYYLFGASLLQSFKM